MSLDEIDASTRYFCLQNNDEALTVIMDRGLLGKFPKYEGNDPSHIAVVFDDKHSGHWIVAAHLVGHTLNDVMSP